MPQPKEHYFTSDDYWRLPEGERAELIDGQLIMMAPPSRKHQDIVTAITYEIRKYILSGNGPCKVYPAPFAVNLTRNDKTWVEPDISVICDEYKLSDRGCEGAPDWIIEVVSKSNQGHDYLNKLFLYQKSGVKEYWIVNPDTEIVTVYAFFSNTYDSFKFSDTIPVSIYDDTLTICIENIL